MIEHDLDSRGVYAARWSRGPTVTWLILLGFPPSIFAIGIFLAGQYVSGLCFIAVVVMISMLALISASAKAVTITEENMIIGKGILKREIIWIPLEKIDKVIANRAYVRVSAGTVFNKVDLFVVNPSELAVRLENARREIDLKRPSPLTGNQSSAVSVPSVAFGGADTPRSKRERALASWLILGVIGLSVFGISRCSPREARETACSQFSGSTRLTCERLAGECLKGDNMNREPGCRAAFPNGY